MAEEQTLFKAIHSPHQNNRHPIYRELFNNCVLKNRRKYNPNKKKLYPINSECFCYQSRRHQNSKNIFLNSCKLMRWNRNEKKRRIKSNTQKTSLKGNELPPPQHHEKNINTEHKLNGQHRSKTKQKHWNNPQIMFCSLLCFSTERCFPCPWFSMYNNNSSVFVWKIYKKYDVIKFKTRTRNSSIIFLYIEGFCCCFFAHYIILSLCLFLLLLVIHDFFHFCISFFRSFFQVIDWNWRNFFWANNWILKNLWNLVHFRAIWTSVDLVHW